MLSYETRQKKKRSQIKRKRISPTVIAICEGSARTWNGICNKRIWSCSGNGSAVLWELKTYFYILWAHAFWWFFSSFVFGSLCFNESRSKCLSWRCKRLCVAFIHSFFNERKQNNKFSFTLCRRMKCKQGFVKVYIFLSYCVSWLF